MENENIERLLDAIYNKYKYDFRYYSKDSINRKINLVLNKLGCKTILELQNKILCEPTSFSILLEFLSVHISEMFRDPSYFLYIRENIIPILKTYSSLKIWIAGCSTGEEVYSMAILLKEEEVLDRSIIYATDNNTKVLKKAETGIFRLEDIQKFTINYQKAGGKHEFSDYYTAAYDHAIFDKTLKKNIIFTDHCLSTDSVFSEIQFISCRNVLIYFEQKLQDRAFQLFYDSLCPSGILGIGPVETVNFSKYNEVFVPLSSADRIYSKRKIL